MLFSHAIDDAELVSIGGPDREISAVTYDSRRAGVGSCFLAMHGETSDGNLFVAKAVANGAAAVVTDSAETFVTLRREYPGLSRGLCGNGRHALARVAAELSGHPERQLAVTGITGTNGKTTTTWLMEAMLSHARRKSVLVGTIAYRIAGREVASPHTTPESSDLLRVFAEGVREGATEAVMEVSSHALAQGRVWGVPFDVAVFTNLTRDHLDFHGSMESYWAAKKRLFEPTGTGEGAPRISIVCIEDEHGRELATELRARGQQVWTYGFTNANWCAEDIHLGAGGSNFSLRISATAGAPHVRSICGESHRVHTHLAGAVNVLNVTAALAASVARGVTLEDAIAGCEALPFVPGRFQRVPTTLPITVVVDYAHTDDALRNLTRLARELVHGEGRVVTLFGCGGDRDRTKRPLMARAAAEYSDLIVLTSDNPRSEDPEAILRDAAIGLEAWTGQHEQIEDRAAAIAYAIRQARAGDIVLLAGKGHEKTQTLRDRVVPFDDAAVASAVLRAREKDIS